MKEYNDSNGKSTFTALDYPSVTPEWALIGNAQRGFDPNETRWIRKTKSKTDGGC